MFSFWSFYSIFIWIVKFKFKNTDSRIQDFNLSTGSKKTQSKKLYMDSILKIKYKNIKTERYQVSKVLR